MTIETLRKIAQESGIDHARFCLEQEATQEGATLAAAFNELARMEDARDADNAKELREVVRHGPGSS